MDEIPLDGSVQTVVGRGGLTDDLTFNRIAPRNRALLSDDRIVIDYQENAAGSRSVIFDLATGATTATEARAGFSYAMDVPGFA